MNFDMQGVWKGEYIYGSTYGPELEGKSGQFVMYVLQANENNFTGKVIDSDGGDVFHESKLHGFTENSFISFIKTFDKYRFFDENLNTVEESDNGYEVIYEGIYDELTRSFSGDWKIRFDVTPLATNQIIEEVCEGTWWMKKEEE